MAPDPNKIKLDEINSETSSISQEEEPPREMPSHYTGNNAQRRFLNALYQDNEFETPHFQMKSPPPGKQTDDSKSPNSNRYNNNNAKQNQKNFIKQNIANINVKNVKGNQSKGPK